jgi:hypothetical protein
MGLLGIFVGPVVLTLAAALWRERMGSGHPGPREQPPAGASTPRISV